MLRGLILCCVLAGCGSSALKRAGESCTASSECDNGLLCDLGAQQPVCADKGSIDAAVPMPDADAGSDTPIDAAPDAPPPIDAAPDAPPDAAPIDAPADAAPDV
jgi:hypothetical protein